MTCLQVTQVKPKSERTAGAGVADFFNHLSLTKEQARNLAVELMLFAEGREVVEEVEEDEVNADGTWIVRDNGGEGIVGDNGRMIQIRG